MDFDNYTNLSKYPEALLNKGLSFSFPLTFILKSESAQRINYKGKISLKDSEINSSSSTLTYNSGEFSLFQQFSTKKKFLTTLEYFPKAFSQLSIKSILQSSESSLSKSLKFQLSTNSTVSAACITDNLDLHLALTASPDPSRTLGLTCSISPNPLRLVSLNSTFVWSKQDFYLVFQDFLTKPSEFSLKNLKFLGAYQWSEQTTLSWAFKNIQESIQLGIQYKPSPEKLFKLRFDQDANVSLSMKTPLNPWVSIITATKHNLFDPTLSQISLRLTLNPNN